jgi:uncharacterized protein Yka (UPF0111/DUF47 family)
VASGITRRHEGLMTTDITEDYQHLIERTEATVEKFREHAGELKEMLGQARAGRKVQILAMIDRLEKKYDGAKERLAALTPDSPLEEIGQMHQQIVSELSDMKRTIEHRIR